MYRIIGLILTTITVAFATLDTCAQFRELKFKHISTNNGLSNSNVTSFAQTPDGYLWIGTQDGLNRYDGYDIQTFRHDPDNPGSLSDNAITKLFVDHAGILWIGTENNGLNRYNRLQNNFERYTQNSYDLNSISDPYITDIQEDSKNNLWISTIMGLNKYRAESNDFERYFHKTGILLQQQSITALQQKGAPRALINALQVLSNVKFDSYEEFRAMASKFITEDMIDRYKNLVLRHAFLQRKADHIRAFTIDDQDRLWLAYENKGMAYFSPEQNTLRSFQEDELNKNTLADNNLVSIHYHDGTIYIGSKNGTISFYNIKKNTFTHQKLPGESYNITSIYTDANDVLWVGDDYGLCRKAPDQSDFHRYQHELNNDVSLSATSVKTIYEDDQHNLWVGCIQGGVNLTFADIPFEHFKHYPNVANSLTKNSISAIMEDRHGNLWIGYYTMGIDIWNRSTQTIRHLAHSAASPYSLGKGTVFEIFEDSDGDIWVGTYEGGLQKYRPDYQDFITYKHQDNNETSISGNDIRAIAEDQQGRLWIAVHGHGISVLDKGTNTFSHYKADYYNWKNSLANDWVYTIQIDQKNNVWVGSVFGISVLKAGTRHFVSFNKENKNLSHNRVRNLLVDRAGKLWVGTENGLNRFDPDTETFRTFLKKDGLPNNTIAGILQDNEGNIWISTNHGLARYNPRKEQFMHFDIYDGLQSNEFFTGAFCKGQNGEMYFGGVNGLTAFDPSKIQSDAPTIPVHFTGFNVLNNPDEDLPDKNIDDTETIRLKFNQNTFSLYFVGTHFKNTDKINYTYMLEGFDETWSLPQKSRQANYTNLPSGSYTFKVKAYAENHADTASIREMSIQIQPPFWKTHLAYLLYVIIFSLLFYGYQRFLISRETLKNQLKIQEIEAQKTHELDMLKLKFFENISHEFKTPITLITGPLDKLIHDDSRINTATRMEYYQIMKRNSQRLLRLINQLLDLSELDAGFMKLNIAKFEMVEFTQYISKAFLYHANKMSIDYTFYSNKPSIEAYFDPDKVEKILYNLISNAFKFSVNEGKISVKLIAHEAHSERIPKEVAQASDEKSRFTEIIVEDNGIGIDEHHQHQIFERFWKAGYKNKNGTGIGLALTKQLVERHHGFLFLKSSRNTGTTFSVWLPINKEFYLNDDITLENNVENPPKFDAISAYKASNTETTTPKLISNGKPKVLIVEDNADQRKFLQLNLQDDYHIFEAENGYEGFKMAVRLLPDLILSDIMMPEIEGMELCEKLKEDQRTQNIPLVLLTSYASEEHKIKSFDLGAHDFISKPYSIPVLKARIKNILQSHQKNKMFTADMEAMHISHDKSFLDAVIEHIETNISNEYFNPDVLAEMMNLSRSQLYKKIKDLTGQSVGLFIRQIRLKKAVKMLSHHKSTISEIAYKLGFNDPGYFTKCFKEMYGKSPSEFLQNKS